MHGINGDPWKLPSYRFGALVVAYMKDDKVPEGLKEIENSLKTADEVVHPFFDARLRQSIKGFCHAMGSRATATIVDNVIYDSRFVNELPIEERKRQEAAVKGKPYRVPEWWRGEQANYKIAKSMMTVLPKKGGPVKDKQEGGKNGRQYCRSRCMARRYRNR